MDYKLISLKIKYFKTEQANSLFFLVKGGNFNVKTKKLNKILAVILFSANII